MTWGEFKEKVNAQIPDNCELKYIEVWHFEYLSVEYDKTENTAMIDT